MCFRFVSLVNVPVCLPSCKNLIDLRKHLDTHSTVPAYSCEFTDCGFTARSLYSIKSHYKKVHEVRGTSRGQRFKPLIQYSLNYYYTADKCKLQSTPVV